MRIGCSSAAANEHMKMVNYIKMMANTTKLSLDKIDMSQLMTSTGRVVKEKTKINRYLFNLKNNKPVPRNHSQIIKPEVALSVMKTLNKVFGPKIEANNKELKKAEANAKRFTTIYEKTNSEKTQQTMLKWMGKVEELSNKYNYKELAKAIMVTCNSGSWKFLGLKSLDSHTSIRRQRYMLAFATTHDIILTDINKRAGLDLRKNVGQFLIEQEVQILNTGHVVLRHEPSAHPYRNNWRVSGRGDSIIHPYINKGVMCLGNSHRPVRKALEQNNLPYLMNVIFATLSTYSSAGGPWRTLEQFMASARPMKDKAPKQEASDVLVETAIELAEEASQTDYSILLNEVTKMEEFSINRNRHEEDEDEEEYEEPEEDDYEDDDIW